MAWITPEAAFVAAIMIMLVGMVALTRSGQNKSRWR
jgi:predicted small integral membrane protein